MVEETDGIGESFDDSLRIAITVASQFGERISRLREQMARQREAAAQQEYRELSTRFEAERGAARASLEPVRHNEWWDTAQVEDIAHAHETATAWRNHDDLARDASDTIRREVHDRYGIDVDAPGGDATAVAATLREVEQARADAHAERQKAGEELTASQLLFASVDRREREAQVQSEKDTTNSDVAGAHIADFSEGINERDQSAHEYDSSERRQQFATSLEEGGIAKDVIAARLLADGENAKHPSEAVRAQTGKAAKVRIRPIGSVQERTRGGLSR
jgi:colicin import membrane protein